MSKRSTARGGGRKGIASQMTQTLPLTIDGDFGPVEGEGWWMDLNRVVFWCPQELIPKHKYLVRVDLGAVGRSVDLTVEVQDVQQGAAQGAPLGFVHRGSLVLRNQRDRAKLLERLLQINPTLSADLAAEARQAKPDKAAPAASKPAPAASKPAPTASKAAPALPTRGMTSDEAMASAIKANGNGHARRATSTTARPPTGERVVVAGTREPRGRQARATSDRLLVGTIAPGSPPSVLLALDGSDTCMRSILREGLDLKVALQPLPELLLNDDVLIVFRMPDNTFLQVNSRVCQARAQRTVLAARGLSDEMLSRIDRACSLNQ